MKSLHYRVYRNWVLASEGWWGAWQPAPKV